MKLLLCPKCGDVKKLQHRKTTCKCRKSWGQYQKDGLQADVYGEALVIGLDNATVLAGITKHSYYLVDNITISAWIMGEPARNVEYHRDVEI